MSSYYVGLPFLCISLSRVPTVSCFGFTSQMFWLHFGFTSIIYTLHLTDFKALLVLLGLACLALFLDNPCSHSPVLDRCLFTSALDVLGCVLWCCGLHSGLLVILLGPYSRRLKLGASRVVSCLHPHLLLFYLRASCYKLRLRCLPDGTCC